MSTYIDNHYNTTDDGSFKTQKDAENAYENGHVDVLSNGHFYEKETGKEWYADGTICE